MLQDMRSFTQSWVAWVISGLLTIAFSFWGVQSYFFSSAVSNTVVKVGDKKISRQGFEATYQRLRRQKELQSGGKSVSLSQAQEAKLKQQALTQLIKTTSLTHAALNAGYRVTQQQLDGALESIPLFQVEGKFSLQRLQRVLNTLLYSENDFLDQLRSDMLINQARSGIIASSFILPSGVDNAFKLINQKRDLSYLIIPTKMFQKDITISLKEEKDYYQKNLAEFETQEQVSIEYLKLSLKDVQSHLKFSNKEIKQYYSDNLDNYTMPKRWHVSQILIRVPENADKKQLAKVQAKVKKIGGLLKNGKDFSEVAKQYSEDIASAKKGGVMPWFSAGMLDPAFDKTVRQLKVGQVSNSVRTKYGFNIIKLLGVKEGKVRKFSDVKKQVKVMLAQDKAQKVFADQNEQLANLTYANSSTLLVAGKALKLPINKTGLFSKEGGKSGITADQKIVRVAFGDAALVQGYNSDPIQLDPETVVVLRVAKHKAASVKTFKDVRKIIASKLKSQKATLKARELGQLIISKLKKGSSEGKVAKKHKLKWITVNNVTRRDKRLKDLLVKDAFALPKPLAKDPLVISGFALASGDYALLHLKKVTNGNLKKLSAKQRKTLGEQLATARGQLDYALYVKEKMKQTKIKVERKDLVSSGSLEE